MTLDISIRGIRSPIPSGYVIGRTDPGTGNAHLIPVRDLANSMPTGAPQLPPSGVTAGSYTNTNLTVDAEGRVTAASNGSSGGSGGLYGPILSTVPTQSSTGLTNNAPASGAAVTVSDAALGVSLVSTTAGGIAYTSSVPSTPYTITALVGLGASTGAAAALGWYDGTKLHFCYVGNPVAGSANKMNVQRNSAIGTFSSSDFNTTWNLNWQLAWLQIEDDGTTVYFRASPNGVNFDLAYSVAKASGYLTSYSALMFGNPGGTAGKVLLMSWTQS